MQLKSNKWITVLIALAASGPVILFLPNAKAAPEQTASRSPAYELRFEDGDLLFSTAQGYDLVTLAAAGLSGEPGRPALPEMQVRVALPAGMSATGVELVAAEFATLPGDYDIIPAQPPRHADIGDTSLVSPDPFVYSSALPYPPALLELTGNTDLAGVGMAVVTVRPLVYRPAIHELQLCTRLVFALATAGGYRGGDFLPANTSLRTMERYRRQLAEMVINPADAEPRTDPENDGANEPARLEPGQYDYVIISSPTLAADWASLEVWKTRKGVPARIVDTAWIYNDAGYSGTNAEKIRGFIRDAHAIWGATYFLLGGDTNTIPADWCTTPLEPYSIPNDTYYSDYDGDWTVEVAVGRAPLRYSSYVQSFLAKLASYEQSPPRNDFAETALMLGFDLDGTTRGERCKQDIVGEDFSAAWDITPVYDSQAGDHKSAALAALNSGQNLVNHIDHADANEMGVGSTNHGAFITGPDVDALANAGRPSIVYSQGCYACDYDAYTCIAESFFRHSAGGAIGFVGNSRYGWYNPGLTTTLSFRYDREFFSAIFDGDHEVLGDCFVAHKNVFLPADDTYRYIFTELSLLGDPELPIWTADPQPLAVAHAPSLPLGPTDFSVEVNGTDGLPLAGAQVCLWKGDEIYLRGETDGTGQAVFHPEAVTEGPLQITVTHRNNIPYIGEALARDQSVDVIDAASVAQIALLPARQNPFSERTAIRLALAERCSVELRIYDVAGREVRRLLNGEALSAGVHAIDWDGRADDGRRLASGIYLCRLTAGGKVLTQQLIIAR